MDPFSEILIVFFPIKYMGLGFAVAEVDDPAGRRRHSELRPLLAPAAIATASTGEGAMGMDGFPSSSQRTRY